MKLLHAEELARLAGVHKSTVLLAIRRGELNASRTVGRSVRIHPEDAVRYLQARGCAIPPELRSPGLHVHVVSEDPEVPRWLAKVAPAGVEVHAGDPYHLLIQVGAEGPPLVVVDLDLASMNPVQVVRALRASPGLGDTRVVAIGAQNDLFWAARSAGAAASVRRDDPEGLKTVLRQLLADAA
ncbi:MAG: excisionase family DNA-binding protein [Deltaproteobacteria bacterium]|nr:excisionase family DNA-binding protein [Deltaproteobacteria bacterium]